MKIKNIFNTSLLMALPLGSASGLLTSCGDFLELEPQNVITIDQFWNEESDVEKILTGAYCTMQGNAMMSRMLVWGEFRSENIVPYTNNIEKDLDLFKLLNENITANNGYTDWTPFYSVINTCNLVLKYAPKVAENDPSYSDSELKAHVAEAIALRSLSYFYLIRTFKNVPYSEEPFLEDGQTLDLPQSDFDFILNRLIASLEEVKDDAVSVYPETKENYNSGRVTKWFVYALLSELHLWNGNYDACIKYADLVIERKIKEAEEDDATVDYSTTNNYPLISCRWPGMNNTYGNAFTKIFIKGNSQESIFEITFQKKGDAGASVSNVPISNWYGNAGRDPFCKFSEVIKGDKIYSNKVDGRKFENLAYPGTNEPKCINKFISHHAHQLQLGNPGANSFYQTGNWGNMYPTHGTDHQSRNKSNYIIYRLTDIMLLKAEALSLKMQDDGSDDDKALSAQAFELVNAVNKRSLYQYPLADTLLATSYTQKKALENLVFEERERELMFEGKRYYDLVRRSLREGNTDYLRARIKEKSSGNTSMIENQMKKMDRIFWPINLNEMKANPNLKQNSAFNSGESSSVTQTAGK